MKAQTQHAIVSAAYSSQSRLLGSKERTRKRKRKQYVQRKGYRETFTEHLTSNRSIRVISFLALTSPCHHLSASIYANPPSVWTTKQR
ncbi:hypothetical protein E2C01_024466 [Portunus trituberculatus]|uniref:Uncharacterized protein n=1 Tax=Portunus trituberculatus TaxID=210409 RepID=A0A5B7EES9_PORTR|nr:hypothetical protein [Portunus trituberculatus]